jgi:MFS family permease
LKLEQEVGEYRWSQLFKRDEIQTGRRVLLAYGMQFMNQMGGIQSRRVSDNAPRRETSSLSRYYITSVLQINVGLDRNLALLLGGVINTMFIIGSLFPTFFLDRVGRRRPMMWGSLGLGICMMMIAILLSFSDADPGFSKRTSSASVAFFFLVSFMCSACASLTS